MKNTINDNELVALNALLKDLKTREAMHEKYKTYFELIKHGNIVNVLKDMRYGLYGKKNFTTQGNWKNISKRTSNGLNESLRICVYTCIIGNYDEVLEPVFIDDNIDYFIFCDSSLKLKSESIWKKIEIDNLKINDMDKVSINRLIKICPFSFLSNYDYSIYIDGNIQIVGSMMPLINLTKECGFGLHSHPVRDCIYDEAYSAIYFKKKNCEIITKQIDNYKKQGFPKHYGLFENSILIRNHNDDQIKILMDEWWREFCQYPSRDQLSLPFVIWKTGFDREKIYILGDDLEKNPRFNRYKHK